MPSIVTAQAETAAAPLLQLRELRVAYRKRCVVDGVDFDLRAGEALGLVGESGSGKSQTALAIMGLQDPAARVCGSVRFDGAELVGCSQRKLNRLRGARIGMVFQNPMQCLNPYLRIGVQMAEVLQVHRGVSRRAALAECRRLLDAVQVADAANRLRQYPHQLSGGLCQRVMIATALLCGPQLLIADEPTTALDVTVQAQLLDLLARLRRELHLSLLLISHDLGVVAELCEQIVVMRGGEVVEHGMTAGTLLQPQHAYTRELLAARPLHQT